uniref:RING-type E3 ubiquitin transferase n=1 Tax=Zea mays TaxID=4577 RepID=A0A804NTJ9_MAIZE
MPPMCSTQNPRNLRLSYLCHSHAVHPARQQHQPDPEQKYEESRVGEMGGRQGLFAPHAYLELDEQSPTTAAMDGGEAESNADAGSSTKYDEENLRSITKCEHHFHLCCILEWMERKDTCPVCDQITLVDEMFE